MDTLEKIKIIIKSSSSSSSSSRFLKDVMESGVLHGRFTEKQTAIIDRMFENSQKAVSTPKKYALGEIQLKEESKCWDCADSGFVRLKRLENYESWAKFKTGSAPCHCLRGKELIEAGLRKKERVDFGPQFGERWKKSYEIIPEYTELSGIFTRDHDEDDVASNRKTNRELDTPLPSHEGHPSVQNKKPGYF